MKLSNAKTWALLLVVTVATLLLVTAAAASGGQDLTVGDQLRRVLTHTINFVIFVGLLVYFIRRPLKDFLANRRLTISQQLDESRDMMAAAQTRYSEIDERLAAFGDELEEMLQQVRQECATERQRAIVNAERAAVALEEAAHRGVDKELDKAKHDLRTETVELAMDLAEQVLRSQVTAEDHRRLTGEYFERIERDAKP